MLQDLMTRELVTCPSSTPVQTAARLMRDQDIGDVLVERDGQLVGILTDRDIVVRGLADRPDLGELCVGDICTADLQTVEPDADVGDVIKMMEEHALRRVPVVEGRRPVGIVTLGDLAMHRDQQSALGQISAAPPNS